MCCIQFHTFPILLDLPNDTCQSKVESTDGKASVNGLTFLMWLPCYYFPLS